MLAGAVLALAVVAVLIIVLSSGGSTPKGQAASTPNSSSAHVAVSSLGELPAGGIPGAVAVVDQQTVAVAEPASGRLSLMYRSGRPARPIAVGAGPSALAVDPTGRLWVADAGAGDVRVVAPVTGKQLADIKLGGAPAAIAIGGGNAWVADQRGNDVRRIGLQNLRPVGGAIRTPGQQPGALAYDPSGAVWVVNKGSSDVTVIRNGRAGPAQFVGGGAISISADATAGVWVGTNSGTVTRLSESGTPQGQPLQLHGGAAIVAVLGDTVWVLTHDDATLSSVAPGATPTITARQSMSPAQAPTALSCIPGECAAPDQPTRQVVLATF